ncbi:MAG: transcription antitermination factor NusB, partial [Leptotrichiaceae bacterium]
MDNIKLDLVDLLDEIYQGKYSNIQLNHYFQIKKYTKQEKAFMTNIVNTVLKNTLLIDYVIEKAAKNIQKRRIRQLLRISVAQLVVLKNDAPGVVYEAVELAKNINKFQASFVNATLQNISKNKDQIISEIPTTMKESILYSYPQWLVNKLKADFPEDYIDIMKSYKERSYLSIRRDPTQITEDQFNVLIDKLSTKILFQVGNVYYLDKAEILSTDEFKSGKLIVQDASSYLAAMNLDVKENEKVLDACSSPGGKSLTILQEFQSDTVKVDLTSTDIHEHKIKLLEDLKAKYSYKNWKIILNDAKSIEMLGQKFDKILLDVPCTGLGVLRKKPEKIYNMTS